jgi:flagellar motor component MotA
MKHNPREVREGLKALLEHDTPAPTKRAIREAIELIATMQADLRRQGFHEYEEKDPDID